MYVKNTAYTEKIVNTSINRVATGEYTFRDIENIYMELFKKFVQEPTKKNNEEWFKFQLKYVPFNKQELSPEFVNNIYQMLDTLIEEENYQVFDIVQTRIVSFLSTVIDQDNYLKILEKIIAFLSDKPQYSEEVEEYKNDLASLKNLIKFLESSKETKETHEHWVTLEELQLYQALEESSDSLLDLNLSIKRNFLSELDQKGVKDIVTDK